MKAIILYDGTDSGLLSVQTACRDALAVRLQEQTSEKPTNQLLVLLFEALEPPSAKKTINEVAIGDRAAKSLEQALAIIEDSVSFTKVASELVMCNPADFTEVLINRAKEWQADSLYLALGKNSSPYSLEAATSPKPKKLGWLVRLGFRPKAVAKDNQSQEPLISNRELDVTQLLKKTGCRLVLTDNEGLTMRLSCVFPALQARKIPEIVA